MKIVEEDEYIFGNRLNALMQKISLPENFKISYFDEKIPKSSNSFINKNNLESSYDSLINDSDTDTEYKSIEKLFQLKEYKTTEKNTSPLKKKIVRKVDSMNTTKVLKPLEIEYERSSKSIGAFKKKLQNLIKIYKPLILSITALLFFALLSWYFQVSTSALSPFIFITIPIFILSLVHVAYKLM
ncbi:hypothetical protein PMALA_071600 [Plasmodium malariae]|nr:hypothetical protein PMALA_071600 [Plasmodium malariae]